MSDQGKRENYRQLIVELKQSAEAWMESDILSEDMSEYKDKCLFVYEQATDILGRYETDSDELLEPLLSMGDVFHEFTMKVYERMREKSLHQELIK